MVFTNQNNRIFYACQGVFVEERNTEAGNGGNPTTATFLSGVQAVGVSSENSSISLADDGRFQRKWINYGQQLISITIERVLDKSGTFFYNVDSAQYTTYQASHFLNVKNFGTQGAPDGSGECLRNYDVTILYGPDKFGYFGAGVGVDIDPITEGLQEDPDINNTISITYPNCLITSINYSIGVDGIRESITLQTRHIVNNNNPTYQDWNNYTFPATYPESGDILKRSDVDLLEDDPQYGSSKLPLEVKELFNFTTPVLRDNLQIMGIQNIDIGVTVNYTELPDVGLWRGSENLKEYEQNRWYSVQLPIEVTCSFTGVLRQPMMYENFLFSNLNKVRNVDNIHTKSLGDGSSTDWQEVDREIRIVARGNSGPDEFFVWDLGEKNYLTSIDYSGGDTGGGNVEATINYSNVYSDFVPTKTTNVVNFTNNGPY